jgi:DNA-binding LytR/AlgR family response regulator
MKAIIIEDEPLNAEHLQNMLQRIDKNIEVVAILDSVKSAVKSFKNKVLCDLIFVDIHLADGLSFEIFQEVDIQTPVIFTTSFDEYAIKAFKLNSIDYLLKPIDIQELKQALEKFKKANTNQMKQITDSISDAYLQLNKTYKSRFLVKLGDQLHTIKTDDISHFIYEDKLVVLVTQQGKKYGVDYSIEVLDGMLHPEQFFRINRKAIIHINQIQKVVSYFNSRLKLQMLHLEGDDAIVSRDRVNDFKAWLDR